MIFVDPRYGSAKPGRVSAQRAVAVALKGLGIDVQESMMEFGDFAFMGMGPDDTVLPIGVELKTVADFATSMQSGRLAGHQVPGLTVAYPRAYIIVQGTFRAQRKTGILEVPAGRRWRAVTLGPRPVFWADLEKFIVGLEELGVRVRRTKTPQETARFLAQVLHSFWQKPYDEHRTFQAGYMAAAPSSLVPEDEARARIRRVCVALRTGIGWGRSKAVADHFGSIHAVVTATPPDWKGIAGIGPGIVAQTQDALHERIGSQGAPAGRVSARRGAAARNARHSGSSTDDQLDAGHRAQRGVRAPGARRRATR